MEAKKVTPLINIVLLVLLPCFVAAANDLLLRAPDCGFVYSQYIANGEQAAIDEFPWSTLVYIFFKDNNGSFRCGGTLINNRWVITAAHCFDFPDVDAVEVTVGEWNVDTVVDYVVDRRGVNESALPSITLEASVFVHDLYKAERYQAHDIALLKLSAPVEFTHFVKPLCLPLAPELREDRLVGADVYVTGWGLVDETKHTLLPILRKALLTVVDGQRCSEQYAAEGRQVTDEQLCALGENQQDTCKGDSGGPLIMDAYDARHRAFSYLAGVTSYGKKPCESPLAKPGVYTRVGAYIDWIIKTMTDNS